MNNNYDYQSDRARDCGMRADVKRTAEKLAKAHPDSDSIKFGFRMAFGKEKESR